VDGIYHNLVALNAERGYKVNTVGTFNLKLIYGRHCMRGSIVFKSSNGYWPIHMKQFSRAQGTGEEHRCSPFHSCHIIKISWPFLNEVTARDPLFAAELDSYTVRRSYSGFAW
jgi:hypothetical protein